MIRINQLKLSVVHGEEQLEQKICKILKIPKSQLISWKIVRQSIDARKKPQLWYVYTVDVSAERERDILKKVNDNNIMLTKEEPYLLPSANPILKNAHPVIVGAGPAGLFCAYVLTLSGISPIVVERGKPVLERRADVEAFWRNGMLDPSSNVQFGEGGAGTFSDGKLNTLVKDPRGRNRFVLETFVRFGAPERILYESRPHIGTDILSDVILQMRTYMQEHGAQFLFSSCMTDYETDGRKIRAVELNHAQCIRTGHLVLAIGHSARDTFRMLAAKGDLSMEAKAFAVGFRVEHPQEELNRLQYGDIWYRRLPPASYKVTYNLRSGMDQKTPDGQAAQRGVYSFCMCPGGYVVNASSEEKRLAVNGMSYSARDGANANSAIIVSVSPGDFSGNDALAGVRFQEQLEEHAFLLGNGQIPQQLFGDFCADRASTSYGDIRSATMGASVLTNLRGLLPGALEDTFIAGMHSFSHSLPGFDREDAVLSGVESRTSSPVRISRDKSFSAAVSGIYPCGEGAGYAGGIMSAAMDGLKVAEAILQAE